MSMNYFPASKNYPNSTWHLSEPENILAWAKSLPVVNIRHIKQEDNPCYEVNINREKAKAAAAAYRAKKLGKLTSEEEAHFRNSNRQAAKTYYYKNKDNILAKRRKHYHEQRASTK